MNVVRTVTCYLIRAGAIISTIEPTDSEVPEAELYLPIVEPAI